MNNKIYIIATAENKHLIIPYLESLGGVNTFGYTFESVEYGENWYINPITNRITYDFVPQGYTEYKFPEQPSEIDLLKKENEQLRELLKDFVKITGLPYLEIDSNILFEINYKAKQLLK